MGDAERLSINLTKARCGRGYLAHALQHGEFKTLFGFLLLVLSSTSFQRSSLKGNFSLRPPKVTSTYILFL